MAPSAAHCTGRDYAIPLAECLRAPYPSCGSRALLHTGSVAPSCDGKTAQLCPYCALWRGRHASFIGLPDESSERYVEFARWILRNGSIELSSVRRQTHRLSSLNWRRRATQRPARLPLVRKQRVERTINRSSPARRNERNYARRLCFGRAGSHLHREKAPRSAPDVRRPLEAWLRDFPNGRPPLLVGEKPPQGAGRAQDQIFEGPCRSAPRSILPPYYHLSRSASCARWAMGERR